MIDRERRTLKVSKSFAAAVAVITFTAGLFLEIRRDTATRSLSAPAVTTAAAQKPGTVRRSARRTVRRTTRRVNALPSGCSKVVVDGVAYQQCGGSYYLADGSGYVIVVFE
ncbi:hypothetical protein [Roseibium album]|uniref:hypothetical protein n=1 Tax=Roseibium album TaxID=311410 RepID=UPI000D55A679